jgi:hypothetical protein
MSEVRIGDMIGSFYLGRLVRKVVICFELQVLIFVRVGKDT